MRRTHIDDEQDVHFLTSFSFSPFHFFVFFASPCLTCPTSFRFFCSFARNSHPRHSFRCALSPLRLDFSLLCSPFFLTLFARSRFFPIYGVCHIRIFYFLRLPHMYARVSRAPRIKKKKMKKKAEEKTREYYLYCNKPNL